MKENSFVPQFKKEVILKDAFDQELLKKFRDGDEDALLEIFKKYESNIRGVIYKVVNNEPDTDDICQEVYIKALLFLREHPNNSIYSFKHWLNQIAYNSTIDVIRKRQNTDLMPDVGQSQINIAPTGMPTYELNPEEKIILVEEEKEEEEKIQEEIRNLSALVNNQKYVAQLMPLQQEILNLLQQDVPRVDIAERLGIKLRSVRYEAKRAVDRLKLMSATEEKIKAKLNNSF